MPERLLQHRCTDIVVIGAIMGSGAWPGQTVRHRDDPRSFGVVVSIVGTECCVLWSRVADYVIPVVDIDIKTDVIQATSRKLKVDWTALEAADDIKTINPQTLKAFLGT